VKPSGREEAIVELLGGSFVTLPYVFLQKFATLELSAEEFLILVQILGASQIRRTTDLSAQEIAGLCGLALHDVMSYMDKLLRSGFLAIGERLDEQGTRSNYYDLRPLWNQLRGKDIGQPGIREWHKDPVTLFEEEFGRPLSGLECDQIRQWLDVDGHPEWMLTEALREAVLTNKYSFKYIDRILFDWQRNRIRTKQELDAYRQDYRERAKAREETVATKARTNTNARTKSLREANQQSDKYSTFYQLFPDS
jgi:DNA replication protein